MEQESFSPGRQGIQSGATRATTGNRADQTASAVGDTLSRTADTLREQRPEEGRLADAAGSLAGTLEQTGNYLREHGMSGVIQDVEGLIRRYPVQALLLGTAVGYLLSRARVR